jgi:predicted 3-demethylubiquinone-9 3-methyltransferase (glyoxalase superfamily)
VEEKIMQKIVPSLWFDHNAEEAIDFYISVFKNSKVINVSRYGKDGMGPEGSVMAMTFELEGQQFMAINGGPIYTFSPAISFLVNCDSQAELDFLWEKLTKGAEEVECGWLKDKYGVSWQIVPTVLAEMMSDPDPVKSNRVMQALLKMKKLDIAALKQAYEHG